MRTPLGPHKATWDEVYFLLLMVYQVMTVVKNTLEVVDFSLVGYPLRVMNCSQVEGLLLFGGCPLARFPLGMVDYSLI